jgi:hypothetical protein
VRGGSAYMRTSGKSARGWSAIAAPAATHHGRKNTMRATSARESDGGAHGASGGAGVSMDLKGGLVSSGLVGADGSVS